MDALEEFETKAFVSRLLGKGDVRGLARKLDDAIPEASQKELMEQMQKGSMTLRSFRGFMQQMSSVGSMSSVRPAACAPAWRGLCGAVHLRGAGVSSNGGLGR